LFATLEIFVDIDLSLQNIAKILASILLGQLHSTVYLHYETFLANLPKSHITIDLPHRMKKMMIRTLFLSRLDYLVISRRSR
jgi:hypothetical protein